MKHFLQFKDLRAEEYAYLFERARIIKTRFKNYEKYQPLVDAVMDAAQVLQGKKKKEDLLFIPPENGSIMGSKNHRPSAEQKVTGAWDFGADIALHMPPDTLQLALALPLLPTPHRNTERSVDNLATPADTRRR